MTTTQQQNRAVGNIGLQRVLWVIDSHDVTPLYFVTPQTAIANETIAAYAQAIAPSIDHYTVASLECWFQASAVDGIDGETYQPDDHHQQEGYQESE
jgi:hypothetical protein